MEGLLSGKALFAFGRLPGKLFLASFFIHRHTIPFLIPIVEKMGK
jgi:hypothetical protein